MRTEINTLIILILTITLLCAFPICLAVDNETLSKIPAPEPTQIISPTTVLSEPMEARVDPLKSPTTQLARSSEETTLVFKATAYDLSVTSCGKSKSNPEYGITASGFNLSGMSRTEAMTIAVDPKIIKLGTKVRLTFVEDYYSKYNGVYTARDTGGAIKGNKIDVYLGEGGTSIYKEVDKFGITKVLVEILK